MWATDLFLFCFRVKMKRIIVSKNKTQNVADLGVDLEAAEVVSEEDVMRVVVMILEVDAAVTGVDVGVTMVIGVDVGVTMVIRVDVGVTIMIRVDVGTVVTGVVAADAVVLGVVAVAVEEVLRAENHGAETIEIATDQENRGETMITMIKEVLRVISIKGNLSISGHHLKIKKSPLTINVFKYMIIQR